MKEYNITLTEDEIEIIKDALNYQDVHYYHRKINAADRKNDKVAKKFWRDEWHKSIEVFCKLIRINDK